MKNLILVASLLFSSVVFSQETIHFTGEKESINGFVTRIDKDSVYIMYMGHIQRIPMDRITGISTPDKYKKYLITTHNFDSDNLKYTNYSLDKYRIQTNTGRLLMFAGIGVVTGFSIATWQGAIDDIDIMYGGMVAGYSISLIGLIVELNANHWLKNLSLCPEYKPGIGYTYTF